MTPTLSFAQPRPPVAVDHTGDDSVGTAVAFYLKEALRASQSFDLVLGSNMPRIVALIVSLDNEFTRPTGISSAIRHKFRV